MEKEITYQMNLKDWSVTGNGNIKEVMTRELNLSRKEISRLKFDGEILLNGERTRVNDRMRVGDTLTLRFPEAETGRIPILEAEPEILYENEDMVIVNKPAGIPCHPVHNHINDSMGTILASYYRKQGYDFVIRPVGRLDKDVSGAIIYAKNRLAASRLSKDREDGKLRKYYTAFVMGVLEAKRGIIDIPIAKVEGQRRRVSGEEDGKPASTYYQVTHEFHVGEESISVLAVEIETGRTHQIRFHLASIGHPLLGDELYGGDMKLMKRPALHCAKVLFLTPFERTELEADAPLPADLKQLVEHPEEIHLEDPEPEEDPPQPEPEEEIPEPEEKMPEPEYSDAGEKILASLKQTSELTEVEEPAVSSGYEKKTRRRIKLVPVLIIAAILLIAIIAAVIAFSHYHTTVRREEAEELYSTLRVEFKKGVTVEYGGDFHPNDYVESAEGELTVSGSVDTRKLGTQDVTYTVSGVTEDGTLVSRDFVQTFEVKDTIEPIITLKEENVTVSLNEAFDPKDNVELAEDPVDGKLKYTVDTGDFTAETAGTYTVTVTASDKNGNETVKKFRVVVTPEESPAVKTPEPSATPAAVTAADSKKPVITLNAMSVSLSEGDSFSAGSLIGSVTDDTDGDLPYTESLVPGSYTVVSNVDSTKPGEYSVLIKAIDKAGNQSEETAAVTVKSKPTPAPVTVSSGGSAKDTIYSFLTSAMGLNRAQACGVLSNMHRESRFSPTADNGIGYYGLCQWGNERKDSLISWCEENGYDYTTLDGQLHFLQYEMPLYYPNTTAQLRACPNTEEGARKASWIFAIGYEVAGETYAEMSQDKAAEYFNE
ncbi:MAG: RluA family pseudouridine synthase [Solobacterium sp.]|nr:RluA family pseudouridine synthase [Solobacterium sp.]